MQKNVEVFIGLRDKIEHRSERHLDPARGWQVPALIPIAKYQRVSD